MKQLTTAVLAVLVGSLNFAPAWSGNLNEEYFQSATQHALYSAAYTKALLAGCKPYVPFTAQEPIFLIIRMKGYSEDYAKNYFNEQYKIQNGILGDEYCSPEFAQKQIEFLRGYIDDMMKFSE